MKGRKGGALKRKASKASKGEMGEDEGFKKLQGDC